MRQIVTRHIRLWLFLNGIKLIILVGSAFLKIPLLSNHALSAKLGRGSSCFRYHLAACIGDVCVQLPMLGFDCRLDILHLFHEIPTCYVDNTTQIPGVSIVVPTCKPPTLKAVGTDFCGKLQPAQNRFGFCGPPESNKGLAGGTLRRKPSAFITELSTLHLWVHVQPTHARLSW